jgi:hypothetical protein
MTTHSKGNYKQHCTGRYKPTPKQLGNIRTRDTEREHPAMLKQPYTLKQLMDYVEGIKNE